MKSIVVSFLLPMLFACSWLTAQEGSLLLKNITCIDVVTGTAKPGHVLIREGKIAEITSGKNIPAADRIVDGTGKWLIPGLVDAHIHLFQSGGIYTRPDVVDLTAFRPYAEEQKWVRENATDLLRRYLRLGITTVIDVGGPLANYALRDKVRNAGAMPNLFLTGPLISTYQPEAFQIDDPPIIKVSTPEEAVALVQKQLPYKPDFIKIWYIVLPDQSAASTYDIVRATIEESHRHNLKVAVHATELSTAKLAMQAGADILVHSVDDPVDDDFIRQLREKQMVYIPTLIVHGKYIETFLQKPNLSPEDFRHANPEALGSLFDPGHFPDPHPLTRYQQYAGRLTESLRAQENQRLRNLNLIAGKPVTIATGTDAGNIGTQHASSYYQEIAQMKKAGMSNAHILTASTLNGAKAIGKEQQLGSIESGKIADLVVLNADPLADIEAIKNIHYIIKDGHLLSPDSLAIETPENLAQQQLNAYNARNLEAFVAPYSEDVEIYNFPNELLSRGKATMRQEYGAMFTQLSDLHVELVNRIVLGNTVIDQERVTGIPGVEVLEAVAIYKIENNKIARVYFLRKE